MTTTKRDVQRDVVLKRQIILDRELYFTWVIRNFAVYSEEYRQARCRVNSPITSCACCTMLLQDGEMLGLGNTTTDGNRNIVLCAACVADLPNEVNK